MTYTSSNGSRSVAFYLRDRVSKCKSNRPVARRNCDLRVETWRWRSLPASENYCSTPGAKERREGGNRERERTRETQGKRERWKGKERKLINSNHRALIPQRAKDRPARLRLTASATAPFVTRGEKPRNRTCVRNGDSQRDFSRLDFPGFPPTDKMCTASRGELPFAKRERRRRRRRYYHRGGEAGTGAAR